MRILNDVYEIRAKPFLEGTLRSMFSCMCSFHNLCARSHSAAHAHSLERTLLERQYLLELALYLTVSTLSNAQRQQIPVSEVDPIRLPAPPLLHRLNLLKDNIKQNSSNHNNLFFINQTDVTRTV